MTDARHAHALGSVMDASEIDAIRALLISKPRPG
jgi:hypothetical protein